MGLLPFPAYSVKLCSGHTRNRIKRIDQGMPSIKKRHSPIHIIASQGLFWVWAKPMRDDVTLQRRLSLVETILRIILASLSEIPHRLCDFLDYFELFWYFYLTGFGLPHLVWHLIRSNTKIWIQISNAIKRSIYMHLSDFLKYFFVFYNPKQIISMRVFVSFSSQQP